MVLKVKIGKRGQNHLQKKSSTLFVIFRIAQFSYQYLFCAQCLLAFPIICQFGFTLVEGIHQLSSSSKIAGNDLFFSHKKPLSSFRKRIVVVNCALHSVLWSLILLVCLPLQGTLVAYIPDSNFQFTTKLSSFKYTATKVRKMLTFLAVGICVMRNL